MSDEAFVGSADLAALLAPSLGEEKSQHVVGEAAATLGLSGSKYTRDEAKNIVRNLATQSGLVGVVARFAVARGELHKLFARLAAR